MVIGPRPRRARPHHPRRQGQEDLQPGGDGPRLARRNFRNQGVHGGSSGDSRRVPVSVTIRMMMPDPKSRDEANGIDDAGYVKAAFQWQYNLIGLAGAVGFAVLSSSELPLILGAGLELIYLAAVPRMARFQRLVRSWKYAEEKRGIDAKL